MKEIAITKENTNIMRGFAILFVLFTHLAAKVLPPSMARLLTPFGGIGVAIFLFLSGYGLTIRYKDSMQGYWRNRFIGTCLPYLLVWTATVWMRRYGSVKALLVDILAIAPRISYFWYLGFLFIWYIAFYIANRFIKKMPLRYGFYSIISLGILLFCRELLAEQAIIFPLGCLLADSDKLKQTLQKRAIPIAIASALLGIGCLALKQVPVIRDLPQLLFTILQLLIKTPLCLFVVIWVCIGCPHFLKNIVLKVGLIAYELYLVHSVTVFLFHIPTIGKSVATVLFLISTVVLSLALQWISKMLKLKIDQMQKR